MNETCSIGLARCGIASRIKQRPRPERLLQSRFKLIGRQSERSGEPFCTAWQSFGSRPAAVMSQSKLNQGTPAGFGERALVSSTHERFLEVHIQLHVNPVGVLRA